MFAGALTGVCKTAGEMVVRQMVKQRINRVDGYIKSARKACFHLVNGLGLFQKQIIISVVRVF